MERHKNLTLKFVWNFEKNEAPKIEAALEKRNAECKMVVIRNKKDKERLLKEWVG